MKLAPPLRSGIVKAAGGQADQDATTDCRDDRTADDHQFCVLAKLAPSIAKALPRGLPAELRRFYEASDGLTVTLDVDGDEEPATIEGVRGMFGGVFAPPTVLKRVDDADEALISGPFEDTFYNAEVETTGNGALARINLLLRLKLLSSIAGESAAIGVDLYSDAKKPALYYVQDARDAWPLSLDFDAFVGHFEKFGTHRWFFAFLDRAAERGMNIDLAEEFSASMAPFDEAEVAPLRARFGKKQATTVKAALAKKSAAPKDTTPKSAVDEKSIERWPLKVPDLKLPYLANPWSRDRDALLALGTVALGREKTIALVTKGVRALLASRKWASVEWAAVLLAAQELTDDEVVKLVELYMPAEVVAVLAPARKWNPAKLKQLAEATQFGWKKKPVPPHVSTTFAAAAKLLQRAKRNR